MQNLFNSFKSKRVWTIIALFALNGLPAVAEQFGPTGKEVANTVLLLLGVYFGAKPKG